MIDDIEFLNELRTDFLNEGTFLLEQCEESYLKLENESLRSEELGKIFRLAHSLKGGGSAVGFALLAEFAHALEDCLTILRAYPEAVDITIISLLLRSGDALKYHLEHLRTGQGEPWERPELVNEIKETASGLTSRFGSPDTSTTKSILPDATPLFEAPPQRETQPHEKDDTIPVASAANKEAHPGKSQGHAAIKVDPERLDGLLDIIGELVVAKSQLMNKTQEYSTDQGLIAVVSHIDKTVRDLQDKTLGMRLTPLRSLFMKSQRIVRDLSVQLNKPVDFVMSGETTEIDRTMVEALADPLLHLVRNAIDHGIENLERRVDTNKNPKGTITLSGIQAGSRVVIEIRDDGGGIDRDRIFSKAVEKGIISPQIDPSTLTDNEVFGFLFAPGFSTAAVISDVSGRGVGLDVVKTNIEKLKGRIEIESALGIGSVFRLSIPLTASINDGMLIEVNKSPFLIPVDNIRELIQINQSQITTLTNGFRVIRARDKFLPYLQLAQVFDAHAKPTSLKGDGLVAIVEHGSQSMALEVDAVLGQTQVVLKPLNESLKTTKYVAGTAILGDGQVALVLDISALTQMFSNLKRSSDEQIAV